jgi:hypothetical protein
MGSTGGSVFWGAEDESTSLVAPSELVPDDEVADEVGAGGVTLGLGVTVEGASGVAVGLGAVGGGCVLGVSGVGELGAALGAGTVGLIVGLTGELTLGGVEGPMVAAVGAAGSVFPQPVPTARAAANNAHRFDCMTAPRAAAYHRLLRAECRYSDELRQTACTMCRRGAAISSLTAEVHAGANRRNRAPK